VNTALYATIWAALVLFVLAQHGRRHLAAGRPSRWAAWADAIGLSFCVIHIAIAMGAVHGWSHAAAAASTAAQTDAIYGLRWGGGMYVNYLFVLVWTVDASVAHARPRRWSTSPAARWSIRIFYAIVIANAAVVFARASMRVAGLVLLVMLVLAWRKTRFSPSL
jgi:hypothetical protein